MSDDEKYFEFIDEVRSGKYWEDPISDLIFNFPVYTGSVNIARTLAFYEVYQKVQSISGHIADIGTWKGFSFMLFSSFVELFERQSNTEVYGFDNGKGMTVGGEHKYGFSIDNLNNIIKAKGINHSHLVDIDLSERKNLLNYFDDNEFMNFKMVFFDIGNQKVLEESLPVLWDRIVPGGVLIMDHFNHEVSPSETRITREVVGDRVVHQIPYNRTPTAYVIK